MDIPSISNSGTNRPGIGSSVYVAELGWFSSFGAFATDTNPGDALRITGDHVFASGKGFVTWETEDDVANLNIPVTGSRSSLGLKPELTVFIPGLSPEIIWTSFQNKSFVVLVDAFGCNATSRIQLGDSCNPVRFMPGDGWKSGTAGGNDPRGLTMKMGSNYSVYFYEGDITAYGA